MITHQVKLRPFTVPNFVFQVMTPGKREDGPKEVPKYYCLGDLSDDTLDVLCNEFRTAVMLKAAEDRRPRAVRQNPSMF